MDKLWSVIQWNTIYSSESKQPRIMHGNRNDSHNKILNKKHELQKKIFKNNHLNMEV